MASISAVARFGEKRGSIALSSMLQTNPGKAPKSGFRRRASASRIAVTWA
jgi:hypothetical protein